MGIVPIVVPRKEKEDINIHKTNLRQAVKQNHDELGISGGTRVGIL